MFAHYYALYGRDVSGNWRVGEFKVNMHALLPHPLTEERTHILRHLLPERELPVVEKSHPMQIKNLASVQDT